MLDYEMFQKFELDDAQRSELEIFRSKLIGGLNEFLPDSLNELRNLHMFCDVSGVNDLRVHGFNFINKPDMRRSFTKIFDQAIQRCFGANSLIQKRINLSIQMPGDHSSILPMHVDSWDGESPFELNFWIPLTDAFSTNSIYFYDQQEFVDLLERSESAAMLLEGSRSVENCVPLEIRFGEYAVFSPVLPHGNVLNETERTRVSINFRIKGMFDPVFVSSKGLGDFYQVHQMSESFRVAALYAQRRRAWSDGK